MLDRALVGLLLPDVVPTRGGLLDGVLGADGADVVEAGLGGTVAPFRRMLELPLLWYPSVARIM